MRKLYLTLILTVICIMSTSAQSRAVEAANAMLVRLSVIEVYPEYLDQYLEAAATVGGESVKKEPGVVCIFPSQLNRDSCQIRIVEIYRDQEAYRHHIQTEHFQTYKQGTLHMVKSLDLVDMTPLDADAMPLIFRKLQAE